MTTPRQQRMRELRAELRKLEDEDDAPPITRAFDDGRLDDILRPADKPSGAESGPAA